MSRPRVIQVSIWFMFLVSSVIIIAAAQGDLWLDEIWSLSFAREAQQASDIFIRFHHDNNHPLNTIFLYCVGNQKILFIYRLFAVLSGIGSVLLVGYIARKVWGYPEALCSVVLVGTSYPLLLYFSEARGYAPAIFFTLASYVTLRHNLLHWERGRLVLFWLTSILGILSHATFVISIMAFIVWSMIYEIYVDGSFRRKAVRFISYHLPPLAFFAWWYVFFLKDMAIGGGTIDGTWDVIGQASALLLGFPDAPGFRDMAIVLVLVCIISGAVSLRRQGDMQWAFFPLMLLFSPALLLLFARPEYLHFRYFIICFPFFFLLLAHIACKCYRLYQNHWRWVLFVVIAILLAGQVHRDYFLLKLGRGGYTAALEYISERSPNGIVRIGSDHDFRNRMLFDFYAPRIASGYNLLYIEQSEWATDPPDWILKHNQDISYQPPEVLVVMINGKNHRLSYRLIKTYRFSGISGWNWFLFRRETYMGPARSSF